MIREEVMPAAAKITAAAGGSAVAASDPVPTLMVLGMSIGDWAALLTAFFVILQIIDLGPKVLKQKIIPFLQRVIGKKG
jgi:uncharacterized membrane protein YczE